MDPKTARRQTLAPRHEVIFMSRKCLTFSYHQKQRYTIDYQNLLLTWQNVHIFNGSYGWDSRPNRVIQENPKNKFAYCFNYFISEKHFSITFATVTTPVYTTWTHRILSWVDRGIVSAIRANVTANSALRHTKTILVPERNPTTTWSLFTSVVSNQSQKEWLLNYALWSNCYTVNWNMTTIISINIFHVTIRDQLQ